MNGWTDGWIELYPLHCITRIAKWITRITYLQIPFNLIHLGHTSVCFPMNGALSHVAFSIPVLQKIVWWVSTSIHSGCSFVLCLVLTALLLPGGWPNEAPTQLLEWAAGAGPCVPAGAARQREKPTTGHWPGGEGATAPYADLRKNM